MLVLFLAAVLTLLFAQGLSTRTTGRSHTAAASGATSSLETSQPILRLDRGRLVSAQPPPGRLVALTFDDGPDPKWTPRIARVLRRFRVPGTFFVLGSRVVRHPGVVRDLHRQGFELGNHTFTHADLTELPDWERSMQLSLTESAVAGATGVRPRFVRPPYSSAPQAVGRRQERALVSVAKRGYLIALSNLDSQDWRRPGVETIVRRATPRGSEGGIVLLHDGGGDRAQTVAALERLIPRLRARGFRFARLSTMLRVAAGAVEPPASSSQSLRGQLLIAALAVARWATAALIALLGPIALLTVLRAVLVSALARRHATQWRRRAVDRSYAPAVSVVVPAYNEAKVIERSVRSLVGSDYPELEVIVVDDGSTDGTGDLVEGLGLAKVKTIRKPNAGKAAALNAGIAAASHELIVTVDADTVFEPDTVRRVVQPFTDPEVGAVAGNTKVGNRGRLLGRWQHIEYVMGFNLDRRLYDVLRCMPTVPGAIGCFRRAALRAAGGFSSATLAEDTDITIALGRLGWRVMYAEDARAWTEAPGSLAALWRQRYRWCYGTMQAVWKHRSALWRPGEQRIGRRGIPYLVLFQILLPVMAPLIDAFTLYGIVFLDPTVVIGYWLAFNFLLLGTAVFAFVLDGESLKPLWAMPLQQLVYRQLMYLVVIQSVVSALLGIRLRWQHVQRTGELEVAA
jgi:cellulose synthase/poly-beta-1,6-N-acetylglucosamine synthase-like glycosyltransferase/peptidoglycan/xylan/chitin deacetylase (PgdA/CDA1 family)